MANPSSSATASTASKTTGTTSSAWYKTFDKILDKLLNYAKILIIKYLPRIIKILAKAIGEALLLFALAMVLPLREELPGLYAFVDAIIYGFDRMCQFLANLLS